MHRRLRNLFAILCLTAPLLAAAVAARGDELSRRFEDPPAVARPWVYWYWLQGAVSREGIDLDLAAMKRAGISGAYLMPVGAPATPPLFSPAVEPLTPAWWALVRHAASEADRLGLQLGLDVCDGFATAGGPWITPDLSMQRVVWCEVQAEGGSRLAAPLPQPHAVEGYYRDIAVLAFPSPQGEGLSSGNLPVVVTASTPGTPPRFLAGGGDGRSQFQSRQSCWIQYEFAAPFTARSLVLAEWDRNYAGLYQASRLRVEASDDGRSFRPVCRLQPPRHGWQDWDADETFGLPPTTARFFRFVYDPEGSEPGAEDLDGAKWKPRLTLRGLVLSSAPRLTGFEGKSGAVWRRSARVSASGLADSLCVRESDVLDLTGRLQPDGRLDWTPPPGRWTVLRIGHTSTGHRNETATAARGLECDKLNAGAVRLQFDRWFGETVRQLGPDLAARVLKVFHVDSWEAGSQNWTDDFRAEFARRRGYDPTPFLPLFAGIPVGSAARSEAFLADVRQTISDLMTERFFGTLADLAHRHGCAFSAESSAPTMTGDDLRADGVVDIPMGEFWLRSDSHDKPTDVADAISGAHVYGRTLAQAEAFTELRIQWDETPALLKPLADREFALGINRLVLHVFAHNPWTDRRPGMTLNGVGTFLQRDQTWWPDARPWIDYLSRCSALLQAGRPAADLLYFTGEELPSRALPTSCYSPALPAGYAADSVNADALLRLARLEHGRLVFPGGASYAALVLPPDAPPPSPALAAKLREFASLTAPAGTPLDATRLPPPDLLASGPKGSPAADLVWTHRILPEADLYFVANLSALPREFTLSLRAEGAAELWNPVTGSRAAATGSRLSDHRTLVPLSLEPHGSRFVVIRPSSTQTRLPPEAAPRNAVALAGPWTVTFDAALGGPARPVTFSTPSDWAASADPALRFYSGTAVYRTTFEPPSLPRAAWLDLGTVHDLARVVVNGVDCGVAWTPPYRVDVSRALHPGVNTLELHVTNTWNNRLQGDLAAAPAARRFTWTNAPARPKAPLLPAGLLGPVQLLVLP